MQIVKIPKAAENMELATVGRWLKEVGQPVAQGEPLVELITDKASFEMPAEESGILRAVFAPPKSTVPVGFTIAIIAAIDEAIPDPTEENRRAMAAMADLELGKRETSPAAAGASGSRPGGRVAATPAARRVAKELGIDLGAVAAALSISGVISEAHVAEYAKRNPK